MAKKKIKTQDVRLKATYHTASEVHAAGSIVSLPVGEAEYLLNKGFAESADPVAFVSEESALRAELADTKKKLAEAVDYALSLEERLEGVNAPAGTNSTGT
ncbi:hypothetical protein LWC08_05200 [Desulfobaculum bizertense]|uniref:hypothetical protein n=1 Tax=Desulfobaculum bizertense TaxID=376490 RepID=UPI001F4787BA|nr:hypothetical protein [Desulfobaculum bizertense]UIJ38972.1 hypothetical protein LWC08_05200 [Desulfobaculum bizertense]